MPTATLAASLQLAIHKRAAATVLSGSPLTYQLIIENQSLVAANNLLVRDRLPAGVTYLSSTGGVLVSSSPAGSVVEWQLNAPLAAGARVTLELVVSATQSLINADYMVQSGIYQVAGDEPVLTLISNKIETATIDRTTGGVLATTDNTLSVSLPPDAITSSIVMTMAIASAPLSEAGFSGLAFDLTATDSAGNAIRHFQKPITLQVRYNDSDWQNAGIRTETELNLYFWDDRKWVALLPCAGCTHDLTTNTITVVLDHLTLFALREARLPRLYLPLIQN